MGIAQNNESRNLGESARFNLEEMLKSALSTEGGRL